MDHNMSHEKISDFSFYSLYRPDIFILILIIGILYFKYYGNKNSAFKTTNLQKFFFSAGLVFLYISKGSPLNVIGHHYLFSVHMIEMAVSYLVVPPLMILGMPHGLYLKWFSLQNSMMNIVRFLTKPLIAILVFITLFSIYHMPVVFDAVMANGFVAFLSHTILFITAFTMWWPVLCPIEELNSLSDLQKVGYVFASGVLLTPACALIMFAGHLLYTTYAHAPELVSFLPPLEDQMTGGIVMKILQEVVYGVVLGHIFYKWVKRERAKDKEDLALIKMSAAANHS
ncbi:cytochrome c oxidase assembly protein [Fictibacillus sp. FJAT-27399]|uniref:cytochrome c oxidase assembly protein n=1 Tax=Fictibacillus sp. FJAT-27399 TaxID=1729689 RepID=UPI0007851DFD|nr:cytochrome c oxidase assembly protein [Fictibacillus sp. FJAT-27399]